MKAFSLNDLATGFDFLRSVPALLRRPVTLDEARTTLRRRLENQASDFCALMKSAVYENPRSPYLELLKNAGCAYEDLEKLVRIEGLGSALRVLLREGVYLSLDEFKGREAVKRGSLVVPAGPASLRNPLAKVHVRARSSGRSGKSVPVLIDLGFVRERSVNHLLALEARNGLDWVHAIWGIPGNTDMVRVLELSGMGLPPEKWFSQVDPDSSLLHPRYRWSSRVTRWAGRAWGMKIPRPEYVPLSDPGAIVRWLTEMARAGRTAHIITWASGAVRISQEAERSGIDLPHVRFSIGGEPVTEAKMEMIRRTGAIAVPRYLAMECGYVAYGCLKPSFPDELHLFDDMQMTIMAGADGASRGLPSQALLFSSLRPKAPFILLNASLGDQAEVSGGSCGCALEKLGWSKRIRRIRSFEKLTAGGMTFLDTDIVRVMEQVLPSRFGGNMFDYQLAEEEDEAGKPRLRLVIHPAVGPLDPDLVKSAFIEAVGAGTGVERVMSLQWRDAGFLSIERKPPEMMPSGKIVHVLKSRG